MFGTDYINKVITLDPVNLVRYYPMIENNSTLIDFSRFKENATYSGTPTYNDWQGHDGRLHPTFDGSTEYADIATNLWTDLDLVTTDAVSVMIWADHNSAAWTQAGDDMLFSMNDGSQYLEMYSYGTTNWDFYWRVKVGVSVNFYNQVVPTGDQNAPVCFFMTVDSGASNTVLYYVNNTAVGSDNVNKSWDSGTFTATIGRASDGATDYFQGGLAHFAIWNTILTPAQISILSAQRP